MTRGSPPTRISILVDNSTRPGMGLIAEHGFAALIERGPLRVLFDSGQGPALVHNAKALGVDLYPLSLAILSHGHYDHSGGLPHVARLNRPLTIVAHPDAISRHLARGDPGALPHDIGMPYESADLTKTGAIFQFTREFTELANGMCFTGYVPRVHDTGNDGRLCKHDGERVVLDPIEDDASLFLETNAGAVVLLGCAHAGLTNIISHFRNMLHKNKIHAIIGGTHLGMVDPKCVGEAIGIFEEYEVECIATSHCTGSEVNETLKSYFGSRWVEASAGSVFEF